MPEIGTASTTVLTDAGTGAEAAGDDDFTSVLDCLNRTLFS